MADNKKLHRVFIAIEFPDEVIKEVARMQEILGNWKFTGKMTELENVHLTLKFLGEIDSKKVAEVKKKLKEVRFEEFEARLEQVGSFVHGGNPDILWINIGGKGIFELQKKVDEALESVGFKKEKRFMSHMTIARVKYVKDKKGFLDYVKHLRLQDIRFKIKEFKLKESELRALGPIYRDLEVYAP